MEHSKKVQVVTNNKKANFNYEIKTKYVTGILLTGTEIKSIREGSCSINEAYCYIHDGELFVKNMYIKKYEYGSDNNHEETRDRKILLKKQEIKKVIKNIEIKGYTLIPIKLLIVGGFAKMEVGIGKGKKTYDKKETVKNKDIKIDTERELKSN